MVRPVRSLYVNLVVTPGPPQGSRPRPGASVVADEAALPIVDPVNYPAAPAPDAGGHIRLPALIPGVTYRIVDRTEANRGPEGPPIRKEFTVAPGQTVDLGDIRIELRSRRDERRLPGFLMRPSRRHGTTQQRARAVPRLASPRRAAPRRAARARGPSSGRQPTRSVRVASGLRLR